MGSPPELLDRSEALAAADALLAPDGPRVLLVRGPAGIGKTALLDALVARAAGRQVLRGRGAPLEQDLPLGLARQLLGDSPALAPGTGLGELLHGAFLDVADRAERTPLLLVADDAHWADDVSLRLLAYVGRRLEGVDARLAIGARNGDPSAEHEALRALAAEPGARVVDLEPLGATATQRLVARARGADDLAAACHRATGGNPLLLEELLRALPPEAGAADVERAEVERTVLARLLPLGAAPRALAEAAAVLGTGAPAHVAARLADLDADAAAAALDALGAAHILAVPRPTAASAPGPRTSDGAGCRPHSRTFGVALEFVHPLVAAAVASSLPPGRLARDHARAARLLAEAGAEPPAIAAHLLAADPSADPWVVEQLRAAARTAIADGGPAEAIALLRRALAEPPPPDELRAVLREAGTAATRAGEPDGTALLQRALDLTEDFSERVAILVEIGVMAAIRGRWDEIAPLYPQLHAMLAGAGGREATAMRARLLQLTLRHVPLLPEARALAAEIDREHEPDDPAERLLLAHLVEAMVLDNEPVSEVVAVALRALGDEEAYEELIRWGTPMYPLLTHLTAIDAQIDLVERRLAYAIRRARERGSLVSRFLGLSAQATLRLRQGRVAEAEADAVEALSLARVGGRGYDPLPAAIVLVEAALLREDPAAARRHLEGAAAPPLPQNLLGWETRMRVSTLALADGRAEDALAIALGLGEELEAADVRCAAWAAWRAPAVRAHRALGDHDAATTLADEQLALARAFGASRPLGEALLLRAEIAVANAVALLEEAVAVLEHSSARLLRAQALVALGAALRRANRRADAREPLAAGRELAHACGVEPLAERARQELLAAGARPRRIVRSGADALTPSELRTAQLAAAGATNRAIAAELFVTVKTVEDHLSAAYRKLDVRGRAELAAKLPGPPPMRTGVA